MDEHSPRTYYGREFTVKILFVRIHRETITGRIHRENIMGEHSP